MSLERELTALASSVEWPEAPDVTAAVAGRIAEPAPRPRMRRPRLAVALVVLLAALLAVLAVPPARTAILDWLGIGGARIVRVDELPAIEPSPGLEILGDEMSLEAARSRAGFRFADPPRDEPAPDVIRVAPGIRVSYIWREGERVRLLLTQFPGSVDDPALLKKLVGSSTSVEELTVDGDRGHLARGRAARRVLRRARRGRPVRPGMARGEHAAGRPRRRHAAGSKGLSSATRPWSWPRAVR